MYLGPPRTFWTAKGGNYLEEFEDAFRVLYPEKPGTELARAAISDGASDSVFSGEWARILAHSFVDRPLDILGLTEDDLKEWLALGQGEWQEGVPWSMIPWHGEAKARIGAFATLLGLTVAADPERTDAFCCHAIAVGDSCLFLVRDDRLLLSFPMEEAAEFDNTPALLCSNPARVEDLWQEVRFHSGECVSGDLFILTSDALACWFLNSNTAGEKPWRTLSALESCQWDEWVEKQRREGLMRNDDTTLVTINVI